MDDLGAFLRKCREDMKISDSAFSLRQVALRLGIEPSYLSKVERGIETPSEEMIKKLASTYGQNEDILLAMAGKVSSRLQKIIMKNPMVFSQLIVSLENSPENAILRIIREVRDGNW